ncbi:MAG: D-alanyl-D-alanine carboxypeptidase [Clostridia bacterium]|nr:D-alanyl-D-alanine carboxypeptidase [Clostridia bacterium]
MSIIEAMYMLFGKPICAVNTRRWIAAFLVVLMAALPAAAKAANSDLTFNPSVMNDTMTAVLVDADTGEVLYSRSPDQIIYPASTTKIMTGLLSIELNGGTLDGEVTVGDEVDAFSSTSSLLGLRRDQTVSIRDLIYGLMLVSGNDAAAALAVHFGGSLEGFVQLMNEKAASLGMVNTQFANPHGLDQRSIGLDHHSTAADMARLAQAAYQNPVLMEVMGTATYEITSTELNRRIRTDPVLHNGNYLLDTPSQEPQRSRYAQYRYPHTTGMKTGLLANVDGYSYYGCLVASATQNGRSLIAAIFADTSNSAAQGAATDRWRTAIALFEYGFAGFEEVDLSPYLTQLDVATQVLNCAENDPYGGLLSLVPAAGTDMRVAVDRSLSAALAAGTVQFEPEADVPAEIAAPVTQGTEIGSVTYRLNGQEMITLPLTAARSVYEAGDEAVTSTQYDVPNPTALPPWWVWAAASGGAVFAIWFFAFRPRRTSRHIGRPKFGNGHYGSRRYSWDDKPSQIRSQRPKTGNADRFRSRR